MWKRWLATLLAALALATGCASGEAAYESVRINFEGGFSLSVPSDWVSYEADDEARAQGIGYVLGSVDGSRLMYVQQWQTERETLKELEEALRSQEDVQILTGDLGGDKAFLMYAMNDRDCTGCLTLHAGTVLNLMFTPQSDAEFMAMAAAIMDSCRWIEAEEE